MTVVTTPFSYLVSVEINIIRTRMLLLRPNIICFKVMVSILTFRQCFVCYGIINYLCIYKATTLHFNIPSHFKCNQFEVKELII